MKHVMRYGTLGPACREQHILEQMLREGMDGVRLNLSHATLSASAPLIDAYHAAANACGKTPLLLIDLQGPELRIGPLSCPLTLHTGERIAPDTIPFPDAVLCVLTDGQTVLLDDGKLELRSDGDGLLVLRGGMLESRKSVALPGRSIQTPALTDADKTHLSQAKAYGVTGVMQPFVRSRDDLLAVRAALNDAGCADVRLFAKIENTAGIEALPSLLPYCDEVVIARGDLGNAVPLCELPAVQKRIAAACRKAGRDFTVVTQLLDSMTHRPVPTRAEVSDVFNAVLDGASSVMLTGETAAGDYPALAIRYLDRTVRAAEAYLSALQCDPCKNP